MGFNWPGARKIDSVNGENQGAYKDNTNNAFAGVVGEPNRPVHSKYIKQETAEALWDVLVKNCTDALHTSGEIAELSNIGRATVERHLEALVKSGEIVRVLCNNGRIDIKCYCIAGKNQEEVDLLIEQDKQMRDTQRSDNKSQKLEAETKYIFELIPYGQDKAVSINDILVKRNNINYKTIDQILVDLVYKGRITTFFKGKLAYYYIGQD